MVKIIFLYKQKTKVNQSKKIENSI